MSDTTPKWPGQLSRQQAIALLESITDREDPYWSDVVDDFYDEDTDTMPSIFHLFAALGISEVEYKAATGAQNVNWSGDE